MNKKLNSIFIDEIILTIFIILGIINIYGDELVKKYYLNKNKEDLKLSKKIFTITVFFSLLIYIYFAYTNYKDVEKQRKLNVDTYYYEIRFIGSIFIIIGIAMLLYFRLNDIDEDTTSEII